MTHRVLPVFSKLLAALAVVSMVAVFASAPGAQPASAQDGTAAGITGPDVVVSLLPAVAQYGSETPAGETDPIAAFAIATTSCNIGDENLSWFMNTPDHPVIRQNVYRLRAGRFEQIGTSWVKHGFFAVNDNGCGGGCAQIGQPNYELRPGCGDPYSAQLNGDRSLLGPTSEINAFTGEFPYPPVLPTGTGTIANRIQIRHSDLLPAQNPGAAYYLEGHYIHPDDAFAGKGENNASFRPAEALDRIPPGCLNTPQSPCTCATGVCLRPVPNSPTVVADPAIRAWKLADPSVRETDHQVPAEGLFILSAKVIDLGTGFWRFEYALYNMNSHRSAGSFKIPIPQDSIVQNVGFHDVHHHSGEPWKTDDWFVDIGTDYIQWSTTPYGIDPNANALRWSTLYNFRFDVNAPPVDSAAEIGLFRPGSPTEIAIRTNGPQLGFIDCNHNGVADVCDVDCDVLGCDPETCGQASDCNNNGIPDHPDCESDCNGNTIPDFCDIADCPPGDLACGDCNENTVPDGCELDCDEDGIPDTCEETLDLDEDGFADCVDECPLNTPPGACEPPQIVYCRFANGTCIESYPLVDCLLDGGMSWCGEPELYRCQFGYPCPDSQCRNGCVVGDADLDGDVDLWDASAFQICFSSLLGSPAYSDPGAECLYRFDYDEDDDVDLLDYIEFVNVMNDPG